MRQTLTFWRSFLSKAGSLKRGILRLLWKQYEVVTVAGYYEDTRRLDKAEATFAAMQQGIPVHLPGRLVGC